MKRERRNAVRGRKGVRQGVREGVRERACERGRGSRPQSAPQVEDCGGGDHTLTSTMTDLQEPNFQCSGCVCIVWCVNVCHCSDRLSAWYCVCVESGDCVFVVIEITLLLVCNLIIEADWCKRK